MARPENQDARQLLSPMGQFPAQDGPDGVFGDLFQDDFFQDGIFQDSGGDPWQPVMEAWARLAARAYLQAKASEQAASGEPLPAATTGLPGLPPGLSPELSTELSQAG